MSSGEWRIVMEFWVGGGLEMDFAGWCLVYKVAKYQLAERRAVIYS